MRRSLWDEAAFKRWVEDGAKKRGMSLRQVFAAAGVSRFYLNDTVEGRSTNIVLNLAEILDISPAPLFGLPESPNDAAIMRAWRQMRRASDSSEGDPVVARVDSMARIIAAQLAALVSIAADDTGSDPSALFERIFREITKVMPQSEDNSDAAG